MKQGSKHLLTLLFLYACTSTPPTPTLLKTNGQPTQLTFEDAAKALNKKSKEAGLQFCYLIEPQIGGKNPIRNPFRKCNGYQFPTREQAKALGTTGTFWLWDTAGNEETRQRWPTGSLPIDQTSGVLLFR